MKSYEVQNSFGIDSLQLADRPEPKPDSGHVLLRMKAWSLNFRDLLVIKGQYNPRIPLPFVPFSDGVGEVVAIGDNVSQVSVGDRVAGAFMPDWITGPPNDRCGKTALGGGGLGMLSEFVSLPETGVVPVPAHLSDEEAATLPCAGVTAWHALVHSGNIKAGETVLVQGTGGVSLFALQLANLCGASVILTSSSEEKLERAGKLGAAHTINYKSTPDWGKKVRELTGKMGVDHVIEVGGAGTLAQSLTAIRTGGHVAMIGVLSGGQSELSVLPILMRSVRIQGIYVGSRDMFVAMNRAIDLHRMKPVIDRVFPFAEVPSALLHMESGAHFGKVCVTA